MKNLFLTAIFYLFSNVVIGQVVIPSPAMVEHTSGFFEVQPQTRVVCASTSDYYLQLLKSEVLNQSKVSIVSNSKYADVLFIQDKTIANEAYKMDVTSKRIEIRASSKGGFLYAVQTLRQWKEEKAGKTVFVCGSVQDSPRNKLRSFLLDSGRQYHKVSTIKKYLDMMAILKMNYFHWHLTEGLGWRIEIKKYPLLAKKGGFVADGTEQQGYYTQQEIKELVKYASDRNITIIPEIDIPGHAEAALSAYPQFCCFDEPVVIPKTGFTSTIFCAGKERTLIFIKDILDEVITLFPSEYIHLGGDEAPKGKWDKCPDCQQKIKDYHLMNSNQLQLWLSSELASYLKGKGKKVIFWEDVIHDDEYRLPDNVIIHWWNWRGHGDQSLKKALSKGYNVICGTNNYTYLNFPLKPWKGYAADRTSDIKDVYSRNPSHLKINSVQVLGMSCALWTDYGLTEDMLDQRLFPRILALAEQMWHTGDPIPFDAFYKNVETKKNWLNKLGYKFGEAFK